MAIKIMVDPGHMFGWNKASNGYSEGTRMWDYSRLLIPKLKAYGFMVGCTRNDTYDYPGRPGDDNITARGRMASGYDLMLSLHTNAADASYVKRPVVIYPVNGKASGLADNLAKALHDMLGNTDSPGWQTFQKWNSAGTADYYGVIRGAAQVGVPCLIVEHMFHTNADCAKWMMSDYNMNKMATVVADTVAAYYGYTKQPETPKYTVGWHQDSNGEWYADTTDSYVSDGWRKIDGEWYYFGKEGYMVANEWKDNYYLGADGCMVKNRTIRIGADGKLVPDGAFYHKVADVDQTYRAELDKLISEGKLAGKGGEGEERIINLSEEAVRILIIMNRNTHGSITKA